MNYEELDREQLTMEEAAKVLSISTVTMYRIVNDGEVDVVPQIIGRGKLITVAELITAKKVTMTDRTFYANVSKILSQRL